MTKISDNSEAIKGQRLDVLNEMSEGHSTVAIPEDDAITLTDEKLVSILVDVAKIEDKSLRLSLIDKLTNA